MKKIKYIFFLAIGIILYSLSNPIYLQYEVNHQFSDYKMYKIENFKGSVVEESYNILKEHPNVFYVNRPENLNKVDLYQINYWFVDSPNRTVTLGKDLLIENHSANRESFILSNGYVFLKNSDSVLDSLLSAGIVANEVDNFYYNQLSRFIISNSFILLILFFFIVLFSIAIATTYIKEFGLRILNGQDYSAIIQKFSLDYLRSLAIVQLAIFTIYTFYKVVYLKHQITLNFALFYFILSILESLVLYFIIRISFTFLKSLDVKSILKNRLFSNELLYLFVSGQTLLLILFPFIILSTHNSYTEMSQAIKKVDDIAYLSKYQTYYGTNAALYDSLEMEQLIEYEERFHSLYEELNENDSVFYFSPDYLNYVDSGNNKKASFNVIYMNSAYYKYKAKFNTKLPQLDANSGKIVALFPFQYQNEISTVISDLGFEDSDIEAKLIDDGVELMFSDYNLSSPTQNYVEVARDKIIIIGEPTSKKSTSNNQFNMMNYFTNGQIFAEVSLPNMMEKTQEYGLSDLVTPSSKLSLFQEDIERIRYYYILSITSFVLSLIGGILITILATHIILSVKKMKIIVHFLQGRLGLSALTLPLCCYSIATLVGTLIVANYTDNLLPISVSIFILLCIGLYIVMSYYIFLNKQIQNILKGE